MLIFDAHLDMAWNAIEWNRDLMAPVSTIREFEQNFQNIIPGECTVSWRELHQGHVGLTISTLLPRLHRKDKPLTFYQSLEAAYGSAMGQLHYYKAMCAAGVLREISDKAVLDAHVAEWETYTRSRSVPNSDVPGQKGAPPIGYILSMEGSYPILSPGQIPEWYAAGLRILGPAHYGPNPYCHGTGSEGGLREHGPALLKEMDQVGMLLDATHLADQSFWEALEIFQGPVLASHHNCRTLVNRDRQLSDDMIKALIQRGAVIGAAFDAWMLTPGWTIGVTKPADTDCTLETVVDHIDHVCQLAGNAKHAALGTDLDGGFGKEQSPKDLETISDLHRIAGILEKRGYSPEDVEGVMYKNWVNFFRRAWA